MGTPARTTSVTAFFSLVFGIICRVVETTGRRGGGPAKLPKS